jgi:hypothetical protein
MTSIWWRCELDNCEQGLRHTRATATETAARSHLSSPDKDAATVALYDELDARAFAVTRSANFPTQALPVRGFDRRDGLFCHRDRRRGGVVGASHVTVEPTCATGCAYAAPTAPSVATDATTNKPVAAMPTAAATFFMFIEFAPLPARLPLPGTELRLKDMCAKGRTNQVFP